MKVKAFDLFIDLFNYFGTFMTDFRQQALDYHAFPTPGKVSVSLTTAAETSHDLS